MTDAIQEHAHLRDAFVDGMSRAASAVTIVATDGPAGRAGVTVSAMTSVSADGDDPTMLTCLNANGSVLPLVLANGCFSINLLQSDQSAISDIFSSRSPAPGGDKFAAVEIFTAKTGAPCLTNALVSFDCKLISAERIGTHHICIGAVKAVHVAPQGEPLLYGMRRYLRAVAQ
ncbi:flavin reductase [Rhodobacterales bacterium LSUCC0031]|nr:flavin reductase [Rhodobacterales bacterium LSUCC0031]